jgi:general secretion pathway protein D
MLADQSIESNPNDARAQDTLDKIRNIDLTPRATRPDEVGPRGASRPSRAAIFTSDDTSSSDIDSSRASVASGDGFDLNFENAPVTSVAKVVLGDILGVGYTIDPRVQGTVTLASGRPISKKDALFVLENALRMSNVALVRDRSGYRILPASDVAGNGSVEDARSTEPGYGISVIPLRYVSAQTVFKLLDAFGMKANAVRADQSRNIILVQGSGAERSTAIETVLSFDADWMKGQSVGIFPVRNSSPEPLITEIEKIMDSGEGGIGQNVVKFQPISRMNSILVVSKKPEYLKKAGLWISRLDRSDTEGDNLKVYQLRYANARQITTILNEVILGRVQSTSGSLDSASSQIAPGSGVALSSSSSTDASSRLGVSSNSGGGYGGSGSGGLGSSGLGSSGGLGSSSSGGAFGGSGSGSSSGFGTMGAGANTPPGSNRAGGMMAGQSGNRSTDPAGGMGGSGGQAVNPTLQNVRITADVTNNTVLVYANMENQRIVEQTIRQIDRPQRQVAIEATIAEVTLNDNLTYGVQFFLSSKDLGLGTDKGSIVNTLGTAALNRVLPGFNLLVGPEAQPKMVLDALHNITDVKVLSNPSLVVLDNQVATLQVGDQVPISTGSATVLTTNNTIVNTIDYRNTGIILRILPRSNANGNVVLDIEQEISNVPDTTTLTPTISQRRVKSSIAVNSGQTVLLAGLISDQENKTRNGIPGLDKLPGAIGDAFSHQTIAKKRIELILLIRPTVIRDALDAHVLAEELRSKMNGRLVGSTLPVPTLDAPNIRRQ